MRTLFSVLSLFKRDFFWLFLGYIISLIGIGCGIALLLQASGVALKPTVSPLIVGGFASIPLLRFFSLGRVVTRYLERLISHSAMFRVIARLRVWVFNQMVPLSPAKLGHARSGDLLNHVTSDVDALDGLYLRVIIPFSIFFTLTAVGFFYLWPIHSFVAVLLCLIVLIYVVLSGFIANFLGAHATAQSVEYLAQLKIIALDGLLSMKELLAYDQVSLQQQRLAAMSAQLANAKRVEMRAQSLGTLLSIFLMIVLFALLLIFVPALYILPCILALFFMSEYFLQIFQSFLAFKKSETAAKRLFDLTDQATLLLEHFPAAPSFARAEHLTFKDVTFAYPDRIKHSLEAVNFSLAQGDRVMMVGKSGSGKSTIASLIMKFWTPQSGQIFWGDASYTQLDGDSLRANIGYLSQRTHLLSGSIRENLLLARPHAQEDFLWQALEQSELADFVRTLPQGLDTWVGEAGVLLSGGQARRLALAQIILKDAPLWILDEPTEGLDRATAEAILATLNRTTPNTASPKTILFITHQPELGKQLNITRVYHLKNGTLSED